MKEHLAAYRDQRTLVLGASGFIGRWVARALSDCGAHVFAAGRDARAVERALRDAGAHGDIITWDVEAGGASEKLISLEPVVTFNLAGYGVDRSERDPILARRLNQDLVAKLASGVSALGSPWSHARLVHVGSALEYGSTGGVLREDSPSATTTVYGETKLAGTRALVGHARDSGLRAIVARLFTVYGPGEHAGRLLPTLLAAAASNADVPLSDGLQRRDFTYVEDVAEGLLRLALSPVEPGEVVNLATGIMQTVRDFAQTAAAVVGVPLEKLKFGELRRHPEEMAHTGVGVDKLQRLTGWLPSPDIETGVRRTIERLGPR